MCLPTRYVIRTFMYFVQNLPPFFAEFVDLQLSKVPVEKSDLFFLTTFEEMRLRNKYSLKHIFVGSKAKTEEPNRDGPLLVQKAKRAPCFIRSHTRRAYMSIFTGDRNYGDTHPISRLSFILSN